MYGYYFLVELNIIDRRLGGKFITPIQLAQFILCLLFGTYESLFPNHCNNVGYFIPVWLWVNYTIFFIFFVKIFIDKRSERSRVAKKKVQ